VVWCSTQHNHELRQLLIRYLDEESKNHTKARSELAKEMTYFTGLWTDNFRLMGERLKRHDEEVAAVLDIDHQQLFGIIEGIEKPILNEELRPMTSQGRTSQFYTFFEALCQSCDFPTHFRKDLKNITPDLNSCLNMTDSAYCAMMCSMLFPLILGPQNKKCIAFRQLVSLIGRTYTTEWRSMDDHRNLYNEWHDWLTYCVDVAFKDENKPGTRYSHQHRLDKPNFRHILEAMGFDIPLWGGAMNSRCMLKEKHHKVRCIINPWCFMMLSCVGGDQKLKHDFYSHNNYGWKFEAPLVKAQAVRMAGDLIRLGGRWGKDRQFRCSQMLIDIVATWDKPVFRDDESDDGDDEKGTDLHR